MKTSFKTILITIAVLTVLFGLGSIAGACVSTIDTEYMVVFHPGITWQEAKSEVASWGNSYELAAITSQEEQRYLMKLLGGLNGEFWVGGYKDASQKWQWTSGETWGYTHWAKGEPDRFSGGDRENKRGWKHTRRDTREISERDSSDVGHYLAMNGGRGKDRWMWYDEQNGKGISGFIVERHPNAVPTPVPPAAMLLGSGIAMIGGLRLKWKRGKGTKNCV